MLTGVLAGIIKRRVALLIVGLMALVLGVILVSASTVTCGKDTMREGDVCLITGADDSPVQTTYEQEKRGAERGGRVLIGAGVVGLLIAGAGYVVATTGRLRDRRADRERRDEWARRYDRSRHEEPGQRPSQP